MSKTGSAAKVKLNSFDDLFSASDMAAGADQVQEIPLSELYEFRGHSFKVLDDEKMQETVESIKNYGVLMPGIARPRAEGGYEIIAGHRRKHGCELAGLFTMEDLGCSKPTCTKIMRELDSENGIGLIEKKRRGLGKPDIIYVKNFSSVPDEKKKTSLQTLMFPQK